MLPRSLNLTVFSLILSCRSGLEENSVKVSVLCIVMYICIFNIWFHVAFQSRVRACLSTCHCDTNMTEVAQVMAVDMEDVSNVDVHEACEVENDSSDSAHEDSTSKKKSCGQSEKTKTDKRVRRNRVNNKENEEEAVNGVAQDDETNTNEDLNGSELTLKKEVSGVPHTKQLILS